MHQFECNTQKYLNNQIHHDVHDAHVHEHIGNETPRFVTTKWIVYEQCGRRSICIFTNLFIIMWILTVDVQDKGAQIERKKKRTKCEEEKKIIKNKTFDE